MEIFLYVTNKFAPRPSSTKTRIKTASTPTMVKTSPSLRDHPPLKQGLRPPSSSKVLPSSLALRDHPPLKQGLRRLDWVCNRKNVTLRDHPPLKQGLRRVDTGHGEDFTIFLRDHPPLKQGLRHSLGSPAHTLLRPPRPSSTKTRIKTSVKVKVYNKRRETPRPSSTKTRIKTPDKIKMLRGQAGDTHHRRYRAPHIITTRQTLEV